MKLIGYDNFDWRPHGYSAGLPDDWTPVPNVTPNIIPRTGTTPAFGIGSVGEVLIPAKFHWRKVPAFPLVATYEAAWINLFKRLDPVNQKPRELRVLRNDNTLIRIQAVVQPMAMSSSRNQNFRDVNFIAVEPFWQAVGWVSGSGGFS